MAIKKIIKYFKILIDWVAKSAIFLSVFFVWVAILGAGQQDVFFTNFDVINSYYIVISYLFGHYSGGYLDLHYLYLLTLPLTIISIYLWKVWYNHRWSDFIATFKKHWITWIVALIIILIFAMSFHIWFKVDSAALDFMQYNQDIVVPETLLSYFDREYALAFQKIMMFSWLTFASTFLLIVGIKRKDS